MTFQTMSNSLLSSSFMLMRSKTKKASQAASFQIRSLSVFFHRLLSFFCWPRKQTSLFFAPVRLCHKVQANLHLSEKAWENNVQFATRTYDASVDGFSLKKGGGRNPFPAPPIFFEGKGLGTRLANAPRDKKRD